MSEFINTIDILGDDVVVSSIIDKSITEYNDDTVTYVRYNAFQNCSNLTAVNFPAATSINAGSFRRCSKLTVLILRNTTKVATLGNVSAFESTPIASGTGYIYVPRDLVDSYKAAANWSTFTEQFRALEDSTVDGTVTGDFDSNRRMVRFFDEDGTLLGYKVVTVGSDAVWDGEEPTKEGDWVFVGWHPSTTNVTADIDCYPRFISPSSTYVKLVERTLSGEYENDRVTTVGAYAFYGTQIKKVGFAAATDIGESAFDQTPVTDANFPAVSKISGYRAFDRSKLQNASFPLLKTVSMYAFKDTQLTEVSTNNFPLLEHGDSYSFQSCKKLTYVNLPNYKGSNAQIFGSCTALTRAIVPKAPLNNGQFNDCTSLYYLDCASNIQYNAVCFTSLKVLINRKTTVGTLNYTIPANCPLTNGTGYVYVPRSLIEAYKVATNWSAVAT